MFQPSTTNNATKTTTTTKKIAVDCFSRQVCQSASLNAAHAGPDQWSRPPSVRSQPIISLSLRRRSNLQGAARPRKTMAGSYRLDCWGLAFIPTPMGENWSLLRMEIIDPWWEWMSEITNDLINNEDPLFPDHMWRRHQSRHCWLRIILENQKSGLRVGWKSDQ